jgi:purine-binding chemotaxis protein CheW
MKPALKSAKTDLNNPTRVNWEGVHQRLQASRDDLDKALSPDPAEIGKILESRARDLASELNVGEKGDNLMDIIEFEIASEHFAVESHLIQEIYPMNDLTPLPCVPSSVMGIVNVRGKILSVINLKKLFDLDDTEGTDPGKVIILHSENMEFGIQADRVSGMRSIDKSKLQTEVPAFTGIRKDYLKGITADRIVILDGKKMLNDLRLTVDEYVETSFKE